MPLLTLLTLLYLQPQLKPHCPAIRLFTKVSKVSKANLQLVV